MAKTLKSDLMRRSIGGLLKAKRVEKGLTLQELADRSELSAAFLSQAERGKATPSVISLLSISKALDTDIQYFISPPTPAKLLSRAAEPQYLELDSPIRYRVLNADIPNQRLSSLLMDIPAGVELPIAHRDEGEDIFFIVFGEIEQEVDGNNFVLTAGDCVHINTQLNHNMINKSNKPAQILWVGTPVIFPAHTEQD